MSKPIRAIIVDDEESARDVLHNLLSNFCQNVEVIGKFPTVEIAVDAIKRSKPDLVFLDIEMPGYAGYEIVNFFDEIDFEIVFVTAYDNYAVKAFEVAAMDYLLKPVDIDRLRESVLRAEGKIAKNESKKSLSLLKETLESDSITKISISEKGHQNIIEVKNIIAIEAQESYSNIYTTDKKFVASKNLKHFEGVLTDNTDFFRSHKSWIVNLSLVDSFNRKEGIIPLPNQINAKLSKYRKEAFEKALFSN